MASCDTLRPFALGHLKLAPSLTWAERSGNILRPWPGLEDWPGYYSRHTAISEEIPSQKRVDLRGAGYYNTVLIVEVAWAGRRIQGRRGDNNPQASEGASTGCEGRRGRRLTKRVANVRFKRRFKRRSLALFGSESAGQWAATPGRMEKVRRVSKRGDRCSQ